MDTQKCVGTWPNNGSCTGQHQIVKSHRADGKLMESQMDRYKMKNLINANATEICRHGTYRPVPIIRFRNDEMF